jgi:hypothetical protein
MKIYFMIFHIYNISIDVECYRGVLNYYLYNQGPIMV